MTTGDDMSKRYDENGQRVTDCCGCYSTYCGEVLVCKNCYHAVGIGEGDGAEHAPTSEMATEMATTNNGR